jgi:hypothetical protein
MRKPFLAVGVGTVASFVAAACMSRPVVSTEPHTSNLYVAPIQNEVIDKIDLLFMIDNSQSMGDKQALLAKAVPQLVNRLVVPRCVNESGEVRMRATPQEACPTGFAPEFRAVEDIHIAVITSSLGAHGAQPVMRGSSTYQPICGNGGSDDDRARLLPKVRTNPPLASYADTGFLAWDPQQKLLPPGEKDAAHLAQQFGDMVRAAGEDGCGYEASLESWYRFLIDPEPPSSIGLGADGRSVAGPPDQELLAQRKAFLRPDSLVAIVMLTDENDCSIRDDEFGNWLATVGDDRKLPPRATSACEKDPNDRCCLPCVATGGIPEGCTPPSADAACKLGNHLSETEAPTNLRCWENKRRFGYDFLYPTSRYVDALTKPTVLRRSDGTMVENPLFAAVPGVRRRDKGLVYLAGIVGVPWQDIADDKSRSGEGLRYLNAGELEKSGRWSVIVGDSSKNTPPSDPFMREATQPRTGTNPVTGDPIVPETSLDPHASPINGHEQKDSGGTDLQYACTFKLEQPEPCTADDEACDCHASTTGKEDDGELIRNRPLCQPPAGGAPVATQYYGKAYPGLRPLEVLRGLGDSAIVASICPKVLTVGQPGYGYEPAVDAIVDRLKIALAGRCLPRPLAVDPGEGGKLPCAVVEAAPSPASCSCKAAGRKPASADEQNLVLKQLAERQNCGVPGTPSCSASSFCMCELAQSEGQALKDCLDQEAGSDTPGYCYVDPYGDPPQGNPALVANCDATSRRLIRFVGPNTPTPGATTFIACLGASLD